MKLRRNASQIVNGGSKNVDLDRALNECRDTVDTSVVLVKGHCSDRWLRRESAAGKLTGVPAASRNVLPKSLI